MSTQPTFTSGPWTVRHATDVVALHQPEGSRHVADCDPYHLPIDHPRWAQETANARLIALSPNLYDYAARRAAEGDAEAAALVNGVRQPEGR